MKRRGSSQHFLEGYVIIFMMILTFFSCGKKDSNSPQVTLKGESNIYLVLNQPYVEQGATATDTEDGDLSVNISGEVNTALEGTYEIIYTAYDAAGNGGSATRWVHVYNEAGTLCGNHNALSISNPDSVSFHAVLVTSTTINNRIWIRGYGMDSLAVVYADISDNQIIVPKQEFSFGGNTHYYSGQGNISTIDSVLITVSFTDSTSVLVKTGNTWYVRHLLVY